MFTKPSLGARIAAGKFIGLLFGLVGFLVVPFFLPDVPWQFRWGVLFWYPTVGALIGVFGVVTWHPVLNLPLPWWLRASVIGAWMNLLLCLFAWDLLVDVLTTVFGAGSPLNSPLWFILEGGVVGLVIGYGATRIGGEGPETAGR